MQTDYMSMMEQQPNQPEASVEDIFTNIKEALIELQMVKGNELDKEIQELAALIAQGDEAKIEENKLFQVIQESIKQIEEGAAAEEQGMPQQAQAQPAATKDFASMMPPSGGGLPGR